MYRYFYFVGQRIGISNLSSIWFPPRISCRLTPWWRHSSAAIDDGWNDKYWQSTLLLPLYSGWLGPTLLGCCSTSPRKETRMFSKLHVFQYLAARQHFWKTWMSKGIEATARNESRICRKKYPPRSWTNFGPWHYHWKIELTPISFSLL